MFFPMIDLLDRIVGKLDHLLISAFAVIIGLISVLIPLNLLIVQMRWGAIWWLHEAIEYALYIGVFLAAPWVLRQGVHIKADVISAHLPERLAAQVDRLINLLGAAICITLCFYAVRSAILEFQDQTFPPKDLRIANWYMMVIFAFSFLLCAIEFLLFLRKPSQAAEDNGAITTKVGM